MKVRRYMAPIAVLAIVLVLAGLIWVNRDRFTPLDVGSAAPDYHAVTLDGDTVPLSSYQGEVVLLNIWATWCPPCVYEMPALQRLHDELGDQGLRVVAVSVDAPLGVVGAFGRAGGDVAQFVEEYDLSFTVLHDPSGGIEQRYQVNGLPTTFILDREGKIAAKILGARDWDRPAYADPIREMVGG